MALSVMNSVFGASESDGSYEQFIHVICVIFLVVMAQIQFFIKSTFNPFTPLQDLAYKVLMVPTKAGKGKEKLIPVTETSFMFICGFARGCAHNVGVIGFPLTYHDA